MPRYVRANQSRRFEPNQQCRYCGTFWGGYRDSQGPACPEATCLACGHAQCLGNGLGRGQCSICLIGLLPGWDGSNRQCQRAGCTNKAVAVVRKRKVCKAHAGNAIKPDLKGWKLVA